MPLSAAVYAAAATTPAARTCHHSRCSSRVLATNRRQLQVPTLVPVPAAALFLAHGLALLVF